MGSYNYKNDISERDLDKWKCRQLMHMPQWTVVLCGNAVNLHTLPI